MKRTILSIIFAVTSIISFAQMVSYSKYDNEEEPVFDVEDMYPEEIKVYNEWVNDDNDTDYALFYINAGRAQDNLIAAPATIIDYKFIPEVTEEDSIPDAIGAVGVFIELINSTPKTIKEITLQFKFEHYSSPVYDIKTGGEYMVLKFKNLAGRTKSNRYNEIVDKVMATYHHLSMNDASYKKLFYNKKATTMILHSAKIIYADGSSSSKIAIFDNGYNNSDNLLVDGPLSPVIRYVQAKGGPK